jgi:type II secretory pathway pseudopilin PulG
MMKPKKQQKIISLNDTGFSTLESLVGMLIVYLLLAAIAPVLVM